MENSENIINTQTVDDKEFGKVKLVNFNELIKRPRKRKPYQKWTSEQKRSLIENRIKYEYLFRKSYQKRLPYSTAWRCVIKNANLEIFGQAFVRKQWQNFISRYKSLAYYDDTKTNYLELSEKKIEYLTTRWEFFSLLHKWIITRHNDVEPSCKDEEEHEDFIYRGRKSTNKSNSPLIDHEYGKKVENIYFSSTDEKSSSKLKNNKATTTSPPRLRINPDIFRSSTSDTPTQTVDKVDKVTNKIRNFVNNKTLNNDDHNYIPIPVSIYKSSSRLEQHKEQQEENLIEKTAVDKGETQQELHNNTVFESITKNLPSSLSISKNEVQLPPLTSIDSSSVYSTNISNGSIDNDVATEICLSYVKQESEIICDDNDNNRVSVENDIDHHLSSSTLPAVSSLAVNNQNHQPLSQQKQQQQQPASSLEKPFTSNTKNKRKKKSKNHHNHKKNKCSYEEKLYRHTKRSSHRIEKRLDALLNVFAQIVKSDYPNVNVDPLLKNHNDDDSNDDSMSTSNSDTE